ncbi:hypothetical protein M0805_006334 [Coniferiporia weirii]|nr:hypothetical protein M0805_006334 [Coniferiporia weirii]
MSGQGLLAGNGALDSSDVSHEKGRVNEDVTEADALGQLPEDWTDKKLLDQEPFATQFLRRKYSTPTGLRTRGRAEPVLLDWPKIIHDESNPAFFQVFVRWIREALGKSYAEDPGLAPDSNEILKDPKLWALFVDFYWKLYNEGGDEAKRLVLTERKARGFMYLDPGHISQANKPAAEGLEATVTDNTVGNCDGLNLQEDSSEKQGRGASPTPKNGFVGSPRKTGVQAPKTLCRPSKKLSKSNRRKRSASAVREGGLPEAPILKAIFKGITLKTAMETKKRLKTVPIPSNIGTNAAHNLPPAREANGATASGSLRTSTSSTHGLTEINRPKEVSEQVAANPKRKLKTKKKTPKLPENDKQSKTGKGSNIGTTSHVIKDSTQTAGGPTFADNPTLPRGNNSPQIYSHANSGIHLAPSRRTYLDVRKPVVPRNPKKGKGREASSLRDNRTEPAVGEKHPSKRKYPPGDGTSEITLGTKDEPHLSIHADSDAPLQTVTKRQKQKTAVRVNRSFRSVNIDEGALPSSSKTGRRTRKLVWVVPKEVTDNAGTLNKLGIIPYKTILQSNDTTCQTSFHAMVERFDQQPLVLHQSASPLTPVIGTSPLSSPNSDETLVEWSRISSENNGSQKPQEALKHKNVSDTAGFFEGPDKLIDMEGLHLNVVDLPQQTVPKPPLLDGKRPRIWAASRQALCEATTWFRAYHGGVYHNDGKAHGYLLGGYSSQRDVFCHGGRLIISHGGGKSLDGSSGQSEQDHSVRALLNGIDSRHPIVLIADDNYALFPYDLGKYMYVVLGLYWIVDAWAESEMASNQTSGVRVKYKFAFQYCEGQGDPWWQKDDVSPSSRPGGASVGSGHLGTNATAIQSNDSCGGRYTGVELVAESSSRNDCGLLTRSQCRVCGKASPLVYEQGWLCLRPSCSEFFKMDINEYHALKYDSRFLKLRPHPSFGSIDLAPKSPIDYPNAPAEMGYSARGWWCRDCGQLCPREKWECWDCPDCKTVFLDTPPLPIRVHSEFWDQEANLTGSRNFKHHKIYKGSGISFSTSMWKKPDNSENGLLFTYELPEQRGRIHLISGHPRVNQRANNLFKLFQEEARAGSFLRRYPLRATQVRGRMLANYFSHNSGVPYKYIVGTNTTVPFEQAPKSVNGALQLIKDRASLVVDEDANFNEILTAAYMEEQRMGYHTDDERGLGPIVSSLSLGSIALMHFRLHEAPTTGQREKELTLVLRHGDVLVMAGAKIQKAYDHTVVPMNFRIAATARCIDPNSLQ